MSTDKPIRILCTGDVHLGRHPARVPEHRALSVEAVWDAAVDYAIAQRVDAFVLTGDVVDRENRFYESFGPLQRGLGRLATHEIETFAVAGNHDFDVFPRLVDALDTERFHLLGRGGVWDTAPLKREGETVLHFVGWSFPNEHVAASPLDDFTAPPAGVPALGILHADFEQTGSRYAPVTREALRRASVAAWLLGHVHRPLKHDLGEGWALYPGSLQPLDPGEEGPHGPWLVEITRSGDVDVHHLPIATLRYETIEVDLSETDDRAGFEAAVPRAMQDALQAFAGREVLKRCLCRLRLVGRTPIHRQLDRFCASLVADLEVSLPDGAIASVDDVTLATRPAVDLEALARGSDPPGVLARLLLDLENGATSEYGDLLRATRRALQNVYRGNAYGPLRADSATDEEPTAHDARNLLMRQGMRLLDEMLAQKGAPRNP